jgi:RimJ/RimL family protein N-acetyltransferase
MKSQEEIELEFRDGDSIGNFPGYSARLEFRPLRKTDAVLLAPVFRSSAKSIRTYLSTYQHADRWWLKDTQAFVSACVNDDFPSMHYLFLIGNQVVGLASFHTFGNSLKEVQVVLAVFGDHQGKGIGKSVAVTMKKLAFEVWGFNKLWWIVDATNRPSIRLAKAIGCHFDSTFEEATKHGESGSGLWSRFVVERDPDSAPAILQGAPIDYWTEPKSAGLLKAVIEAKSLKPEKS